MIIGLVGGIGSGKSYIAERIRARGGYWIDADAIAHEVRALPKVVEAMNARWADRGFHIEKWNEESRQAVAKIVFDTDDRTELSWLESVMNPIIKERIAKELVECGNPPYIVLDIPMLLENNYGCDFLWYIDAPLELRLQRASARSRVPLTAEELERRESKQIPLHEKLRLSDLAIKNYGDDIESQIDNALEGCAHAQAVLTARRQ